jgi:hypothetical protein
MTPEKIAELRRLLADATPGPWEIDDDGLDRGIWGRSGSVVVATQIEDGQDAALIAAAVSALPELLDAAERAQMLDDAIRHALDTAGCRWEEWGARAEDVADILMAALEVKP